MDHFLSGLDSEQNLNIWYNSRPITNNHQFALGNSSLQLIPIPNLSASGDVDIQRSNEVSVSNSIVNSRTPITLPPLGEVSDSSDQSTTFGPRVGRCDSNGENATFPPGVVARESSGESTLFNPLGDVKIKKERTEGSQSSQREGIENGHPVPDIALTPISAVKTLQKTKSGERWDTKKVCNVCGKVLSRGDKLKNHMRTHSNTFPYHCDTCGLGFLRSEGLRVHTRIHTGERPYVCALCGKAYTRKDKLTRHAVIHTGERPFVCKHCGKSFTRKDKMQRHELIHRVDKPFTCTICNLEFVRQETLNTHMEKKHPETLPYTLVQQRINPTFSIHDINLSHYQDIVNKEEEILGMESKFNLQTQSDQDDIDLSILIDRKNGIIKTIPSQKAPNKDTPSSTAAVPSSVPSTTSAITTQSDLLANGHHSSVVISQRKIISNNPVA